MQKIILVRGCGDVGSAVAGAAFKAGHAVVIHDSAQPTATRRSHRRRGAAGSPGEMRLSQFVNFRLQQ